MAITIIMGWLMSIPMLASVRMLKYINFDYSGCDKYPRPFATSARVAYNTYQIASTFHPNHGFPHYIEKGRFSTS
ncbi:hypothetical protein M0Q03_01280 [bacterium]|nr:hypothetical protein [bacterium]